MTYSINSDTADDFYRRVEQVALTDSWTIDKARLKKKEYVEFMKKNFIHYVASSEPLGKVLSGRRSDLCVEKSAGHIKHEYTTGYAHEEIFK